MNDESPVSRREFLRTSAAAAVVAATGAAMASDGEQSPKGEGDGPVLPRRKLGRTGVEITMLGQGAAFDISERHLNMMHSAGVRYIDGAAYYLTGNAERTIGRWLNKTGHRKEYFLLDKDIPLTPERLATMVDERLETLETDYLDMFMLAGMGDSDHYHGLEDTKWFADNDWTKAVEKIRASGKCRFFGFSTHTEPIDIRTGMLEAAAEGGWVDAILVSADPLVLRDNAAFGKAVDACHKAGVGLISMKQNRSGAGGIKKVLPDFEEKGLNAHTAVLSAMWTDERFASVCSHMNSFKKLQENAAACRDFKPLTGDELGALDGLLRGAEHVCCLRCDGSCRRAGGTRADLNTIARYVSYARNDGRVGEARDLLLRMAPEARDWSGADLEAARRACKSHLDFAGIVRRAEALLA
ncbi:MAG TPA: aldo/keto reductase [Phycisphaerae bacterium]|nr:aldo/keto reductase [Phycisphaerae bacterium]